MTLLLFRLESMKLSIACLCLMSVHFALGQSHPSTTGEPIIPGASAPLSREQGEEILNELRLIRKALEDRRGGVLAAATAIPAQGIKMKTDAGWFTLGSDQAPVAIVEFSDFQCPYCSQFNKETFTKIKKTYIDTGKVKFVSREYPLSVHPDAQNAALAVRCAGAQKHYWEMRNLIIDGGSDLSLSAFDHEAEKLNLDVPKFRLCMKDLLSVSAVQRDIADGQDIGVTGTPAFLIGTTRNKTIEGIRIDGAQPYAQFAAAIDAALVSDKCKRLVLAVLMRGVRVMYPHSVMWVHN